MDGLKILLSRLEGPVNLGFIVRAMANTGFSSLAYTGEVDKDDSEAKKFAVHADNILSSSRHADSFEELIKESDVIIGFSPRDPFSNESLSFDELKSYTAKCLSKGLTVGLLFGNERSGLDNSELSLCSKRVAIPTSQEYVSMNLAQAVLVALWELRDIKPQPAEDKVYAGRDTLNILSTRLKEYLELIEYFNQQNPDLIWQEITQTLESKKLTMREAELLISVVGKSIIRYTYLKASNK